MHGFWHELWHLFAHVLEHVLPMLPFLFGAYLLIEYLEHRAGERFAAALTRFGHAGPVAGAFLGCVPQCGFSVAAANLYANRLISAGTLLAVFLSTSDEALPILLSHPESLPKILPLLGAKLVIAVFFGLLADRLGFLRFREESLEQASGEHSHCHTENAGGLFLSALRHTVEVFLFLLLVMLGLELLLHFVGEDVLGAFLMRDSFLQPFFASLVGLIPNCASSIILAQLYAAGGISFGSAVAGLSTGAGLGLLVLFRTCRDRAECLKLLAALYLCGSVSGLVLQLLSIGP